VGSTTLMSALLKTELSPDARGNDINTGAWTRGYRTREKYIITIHFVNPLPRSFSQCHYFANVPYSLVWH